MTLAKLSSIAALATATLMATSFAAMAANAVMTQDADVHKSASNGSSIVNDVSEDDEVTVTKCTTNWCFIKIPGPDGWVKKKYLANLDDGESDTPEKIPFNFGMTMGPGGPTFSFGIGDAPPPAPAPVTPQVCFYAGNHFTGPSICDSPGTNRPHLNGAWNDNISSIRVQGGAGTMICRDWFYGGGCTNWTIDVPVLGPAFNDQISAYKVY